MLFNNSNPPLSWKPYKIKDIAKLVKEQVKPEDFKSEPYIGLKHIGENTLSIISTGKSEDTISNKYRFSSNNFLFGKLRPYFRKVVRPKFDGLCSTDIWVVEKIGNTDLDYLFYLFSSEEFISVATSSSTGTRMPRASWDFMSQQEINIPTLCEQKKIGSSLRNLDDKVEINKRINIVLEELGKAFFKHWFVDFEFPDKNGEPYRSNGGAMKESELGEIPLDWDIKKLKDITDRIFSGGTPYTRKSEYWDGDYPWLSSGETSNHYIVDTEKRISKEGVDNSSTRLAKSGDVVIASAGQGKTRGQTSLCLIDTYINQSIIAIRPKEKIISSSYLYFYFLQSYSQLRAISDSNSIRGSLTTKILNNLEILVPSLEINKKYDLMIKGNIEKIRFNLHENANLSMLRDTLLPRLMSGEIRVTLEGE